MANFLFGPSSMRISVEKAFRHLAKPEVIHGSVEERKDFIYKVKKDLNIEEFLRRSSRKMAQGTLRYWNFPVWIIAPRRPAVIASPNYMPLELNADVDGKIHATDYEAYYNEELMNEQEVMMDKYKDSPAFNIEKTMQRMERTLPKEFYRAAKKMEAESEKKGRKFKVTVEIKKNEEEEENTDEEFGQASIDFVLENESKDKN